MKVNIYSGDKLLESNRFFRSLDAAQNYCNFICPQKYESGSYYPVIVK